jgi:hypothetical protein
MVAPELLVLANYEAARAGIEESRLRRAPANDQAWFTADRRLRDAERIQSGLAVTVLPASAWVVPRAALELLRNPEHVLQMLDGAREDVAPEMRPELEELCGDALRARDVRAASLYYQTALDLTGQDKLQQARGRSVAVKLADSAARARNYASAIEVAQGALEPAIAAADTVAAADLRLCLAQSLLIAGEIDRAVEVCQGQPSDLALSEKVRASLSAIEVRARLAAGDPLGAWRLARRRFGQAFELDADIEPSHARATGLELKGDLHAALFEFEQAMVAWRDARHAWDLLHEPEGSLRCVQQCIRIAVRETHESAAAAQMTREAERTAASLGIDFELAFKAAEAERLEEKDPERARAILDSMFSVPDLANRVDPVVCVAIAKQAIAMNHRGPDTARLLNVALGHVTPPMARVVLLNPRERVLERSEAIATALGGLASGSAVSRINRGEPGVSTYFLDALETVRLSDNRVPAPVVFGDMHRRLLKGDSLFSLLPLRELLARVPVEVEPELNDPTLSQRFLGEFHERPRICGVFLLSEAETRAVLPNWRPDEGTLARIDGYLGQRSALPASLRTRLNRLARTAAQPAAVTPAERTRPVFRSSVRQPQIAPQPPSITVALGPHQDRSLITWSDGRISKRSIHDEFKKLVGESIAKLTKLGLAAPVSMDRHLALDTSAAIEIAHLLIEPESILRLTEPSDLRIEITHSMFGGIPWELARLPDGQLLRDCGNVRCLYRSVAADASSRFLVAAAQGALRVLWNPKLAVDGLLGPATREELDAFQVAHGLPATGLADCRTLAALDAARRQREKLDRKSVVIVRRSLRAQHAETRGFFDAGFDVAQEYQSAGWHTTLLEDPSRVAIAKALDASRAQVLHLNASVAEGTRTGGLYLDVGRDVETSSSKQRSSSRVTRSEGLPVADLVECLRPERGGMAAIVILDPPAVPTYTEAVRQLILRNAFASDAFQLGVVPAIVATGLIQAGEYTRVGSMLLAGLDAGRPLHLVCDAMRKAGDSVWSHPVSFASATSLFSHAPDYAPLTAATPDARR